MVSTICKTCYVQHGLISKQSVEAAIELIRLCADFLAAELYPQNTWLYKYVMSVSEDSHSSRLLIQMKSFSF